MKGIGFHGARVESHANISDGPTRDHFEMVSKVGATWVEPVVPSWLLQLWRIPLTIDEVHMDALK